MVKVGFFVFFQGMEKAKLSDVMHFEDPWKSWQLECFDWNKSEKFVPLLVGPCTCIISSTRDSLPAKLGKTQ